MIIGDYSFLPLKDQLSFIRLLVFVEGLNAKSRFAVKAREIVNNA
jgi:hypothetical protein